MFQVSEGEWGMLEVGLPVEGLGTWSQDTGREEEGGGKVRGVEQKTSLMIEGCRRQACTTVIMPYAFLRLEKKSMRHEISRVSNNVRTLHTGIPELRANWSVACIT